MKFLVIAYLVAFVSANLIVKHFGVYGLWFSSFLLIPFDFVARCIIQEKYNGIRLFLLLFLLTFVAACSTILINYNAKNIAIASVLGFTAAQIVATVFYQKMKKKSYFIKVNGSDLFAIICDSIVFQILAFGEFLPLVTAGQISIKIAGGLIWYFILFKKLKLNETIKKY